MADQDKTFEGAFLDRHPEIRGHVLASPEFQAWRDTLPSVVVDEVQYYIRGGDMLKDLDQVTFEWAHRSGLISEDLTDEDSEPTDGR